MPVGTNIAFRLARGDVGVDGPKGIDIAAKKHDLLYNQARNRGDIRKADKTFISDVRNSSQGPKTRALAIGAIKAKTIGEDVGIFGPETFTTVPQLGKGFGRNPVNISGGSLGLPGQGLKASIVRDLRRKRRGRVSKVKSGSRLRTKSLNLKDQERFMRELMKLSKMSKNKKNQAGGILPFLAGLATSVLGPLITSGIKKIFKK